MRICAVFGVLLLAASTCFAHSNANGFGYFALEWPSDVTYVADGEDGDWAWYDPNFIVTPDEMGEVVQQVIPDKSDIDVSIRTAWTQAPDNRIYGFVRVTDDSLHAAETDPENGWFEDDLEIITDGDHSGGPYRDPNQVNAQQWTMHVQVPGGYSTPYGNGTTWLRKDADPAKQWATAYIEADVSLSPPGATHGSTNVTLGYEFAMPLWVNLENDEASTERVVLQPGMTVGLTYQLNEADTTPSEGAARTHQLVTGDVNGAHRDQDFASDFTLLTVDEYTRGSDAGTAVEGRTWGKIKATFAE